MPRPESQVRGALRDSPADLEQIVLKVRGPTPVLCYARRGCASSSGPDEPTPGVTELDLGQGERW